MSSRKAAPATFVGQDVFRYSPKTVLRHGDRVRVSGGPVWIDHAGGVHRVGERGIFTFDCAAVDGVGVPYLLLTSQFGGNVVIPLGTPPKSKLGVEGWQLREYRIRKLRSKK